MVISQIAGLATAFGTGELSGAGFGPNYTILMKLGYEFFAPRILEEMEKNPNVFFQDTLWFQKFQKQIKLYSDKVMEQTLDTLLHVPQKTLDAIQNKFEGEGIVSVPNIPITVDPALNRINTIAQVSKNIDYQPFIDSISNFFNTMAKFIPNVPQAFPEDTGPFETTSERAQTNQGLSLNLFQIRAWRFVDLNSAMAAITRGTSGYDIKTQALIRKEWNNQRSKQRAQPTQDRAKQIKEFEDVTIPESNIPERSTKRKAGQSVKLERVKLIQDIAAAAKTLVFNQNWIASANRQKTQTPSTVRVRSRMLIENRSLIKLIKSLQQKLTFLLRNYTF